MNEVSSNHYIIPSNTRLDEPTSPLFNDPSASIVLRSKDGWKFRVHDYHLKSASGFFVTMMSDCTSSSEIPMDEDYPLVERWLLIVCEGSLQGASKPITTFEDVLTISDALEKYQVTRADSVIAELIETYVESHPIDCFLWACSKRHLRLARLALKEFRDEMTYRGQKVKMAPWELPTIVWQQLDSLVSRCYLLSCRYKGISQNSHCFNCGKQGLGDLRSNTQLDWPKIADVFSFDAEDLLKTSVST